MAKRKALVFKSIMKGRCSNQVYLLIMDFLKTLEATGVVVTKKNSEHLDDDFMMMDIETTYHIPEKAALYTGLLPDLNDILFFKNLKTKKR